MRLSFDAYRDKVMGCWAGKNMGGVLGAPFEGKRQVNDISFYVQDLSMGPPPNDDLDLQIVWLTAVERFGRQVDASILAEYWLSYIVPNWVEYGTGKANLRAGLLPPISGHYRNAFRNSCGCFIRSEIWACLAPGRPDLAVRYALEDAMVDHSGEGLYGEVFCAAVQSAAFVASDARTLIDIGLSYVPEGCALARCVRRAVACYDAGMDIREARMRIHNEAPGMFGVHMQPNERIPTEDGTLERGEAGFDAPENVGFLVAGWLYGEGDFGKSLCLAVLCGEDTDCTAGTLGAILGIVMGAEALPERWTAPISDRIATMCIDRTSGIWVPATVTEMTDKVLRVAPLFLGTELCDVLAEGGYAIACREGDDLRCDRSTWAPHLQTPERPRDWSVRERVAQSPYEVRHVFPTHVVVIDYGDGIEFGAGIKHIEVRVLNRDLMREQMWCRVRLWLPQGVTAVSGEAYDLQLNTNHGDMGVAAFDLDTTMVRGGRVEAFVEISMLGRHTSSGVKVVLVRGRS